MSIRASDFARGEWDDELCPPIYSRLLWWLIHHHKTGPLPEPWDSYGQLQVALAIHQLASGLQDQDLGRKIQEGAMKSLEQQVGRLRG